MGILKDAIRKVLTEEAQRTGRDIRFIDTPTRVIETVKQAKQHDICVIDLDAYREYETEPEHAPMLAYECGNMENVLGYEEWT